jgi:Secretory lipase
MTAMGEITQHRGHEIGPRRVARGRHTPRLPLICMLALLVLVAWPGVTTALAAPPPPSSDPFYAAPPNLASYAPGTILRSRQVTVSGAEQAFVGTAYQLLYRTTNATGQPVSTVTTLLLPALPASGPRKLLSYQTAYDSLTLSCAPSYTLQGGNGGGGFTATLETGLIGQALGLGWDVVVPDYEGPQSEWAVGPMDGRATLDSIRAVEHFARSQLEGSSTPVGLVGYSGGSEATDWAAAFAREYAPELKLVGIAAGGNFPDFNYTLSHFDGSLWYGIEIGVLVAFNRAYPELDLPSLLNARGRALAAEDGADAGGCASSTLNEPGGTASQFTNYPSSAALGEVPRVHHVLDELSLVDTAPVLGPPSFIYNAIGDEIAHIQPVDAWVAEECARGATIDYDRDPVGSEHLGGVAVYWPLALTYMEQRFAGATPPDTCPPGAHPAPPGRTPPDRCPRSSGRVRGDALGRLRLGMTRSQARRAYSKSCPRPARVRVGYASQALLRTVPVPERRHLRARVIWASTSNSFFSLRGIHPGTSIATAADRLKLAPPYRVGPNRWYLVANGDCTGVLHVRHGIVEEIGIALKRLTDHHGAALKLLKSFS